MILKDDMKITRRQLSRLIQEELTHLKEQKVGGDTDDFLSVASPAVQLSKADQKRIIKTSLAQLHDQLESGECDPSDRSGQCKSDQAQLAALQDKEQQVAGA